MLKINDNLFGKLEYDDSWIGSMKLPFFSEEILAEVVIECYEDEEITNLQKDAFKLLLSLKDQLMSSSEQAIYEHYTKVCPDYRNKFGSKFEDKWAPIINQPDQLKENIQLKTVFFPQSSKTNTSTIFGLLFSCTWEPELGLAVKFIDGAVVEVGHQDIIL